MKNKFLFMRSMLLVGCFVNSGKRDRPSFLQTVSSEVSEDICIDGDDDDDSVPKDESGIQISSPIKERDESFSFAVYSTYSKEVLLDYLAASKKEVKHLKRFEIECQILQAENAMLHNALSRIEKEKDSLYAKMEKEKDDRFNIMLREKDDHFNCMLREKDTRISYLEKNQSSRLDKNVTICLKASCVIVAGCFAWQFFLRDFLFYHFPKLDKGKIERMKREEARLAALRARA